MTTIAQVLQSATDYLSSAGLESPRDDAEIIIATVTETSRTYLITHHRQDLDPRELLQIWRWLEKRSQHYPIQYMRGFQEFYGHEFLVSADVLIPRPETELLVEVSLELLKGRRQPSILDLGTGSGCIAISLLLEIPSLSAVATDVSPFALGIVQANSFRHNCVDRLRLLLCDVAEPLCGEQIKFDLVISNPPYVALTEKDTVSRSVIDFEPLVAIFGGHSGLEVIEKILKQSSGLVTESGNLVLELASGQRPAVLSLAQRYGWLETDSRRDLAGIDRCVVFRQASR